MQKLLPIITLALAACGGADPTFIASVPTCTVTDTASGATLTCPDGSTVVINDGQTGQPGEAGQDGAQGPQGPEGPQGSQGAPGADSHVVGHIDPCGDGPGPDEILLILDDGRFAAWYLNLGLVILGDGSWVTTDSQACHFTISDNGTTLVD